MAYTITPMTPHTGAEVRGLDLTNPVDAETKAALNRAFAEHHVLVVRYQKYEPADFIRAVQIWGELQPHDKKDHHIPGFPEMYYVTNEEFLGTKRLIPGETFHTDHSNHPAPPKVKNRNYTPEDFQRVSEMMAGTSLENFFARFVRGREELDYNAALNTVGLQLGEAGDETKPPVERPYLGAEFAQDGDRLTIRRVYSGSPAYDQGLNTGDQIVALEGQRVNQQLFLAKLAEKRPGDTLNLTIFRDDDLRTFAIKIGKRVVTDYRILPAKQPTPAQTRQYHAWADMP